MTLLQAVDYKATEAPKEFVESLRTTGFAVLKNHPLSEAAVSSIYENWQLFFNSDSKQDYLYDKEKYDGFFPINEAEAAKGQSLRDLKEYFHFYPWGRCPDSLRQELNQYYQSTVAFAGELLGWVQEQTPDEIRQRFSMPLSDMIVGSQLSLLRVLYYPPMNEETTPGAVRAAAHEDINLLTVLPASNEPGLQVKSAEDQWLDVPCDFGNLIINTGDMLQEASQAYYPSTTHRVINPDGKRRSQARISLPLFLHPNPEVVLSKRHTAQTYREERLRELRTAAN
ncbi:MAG: hypothetical protein KTR32_44075 [Granulosicoccus sp.]|nr:hypothetical protein [Granulosicoccus sp.]